VRCGTHSDYGTLTFLFQDKVGGLEVQALDKVLVKRPDFVTEKETLGGWGFSQVLSQNQSFLFFKLKE
jgi:isopenicillin N synthase-like dioxygenase